MELTQDHLQVAYHAWAAAQTGGGIVLDDAPGLFPEAHQLAEQGWLRRGFVDGELAWFWTPAAETALGLSGLLSSADDRQN